MQIMLKLIRVIKSARMLSLLTVLYVVGTGEKNEANLATRQKSNCSEQPVFGWLACLVGFEATYVNFGWLLQSGQMTMQPLAHFLFSF